VSPFGREKKKTAEILRLLKAWCTTREAEETLHRSEAIFYRRHKSLVSHTREYARTTVVYSGAMATESNANDIADFDIDEVIDWDKHDIPSKVC